LHKKYNDFLLHLTKSAFEVEKTFIFQGKIRFSTLFSKKYYLDKTGKIIYNNTSINFTKKFKKRRHYL